MNTRTPSERISDHFEIALPDDLALWLDNVHRIGKTRGYASTLYNEPTRVDELLDPTSSTIWAGQMPTDTLPLFRNGCGDCLSLRVGKENTVTEIIRWDHEGGAWSSYGSSLSEALLLDAARAYSGRRVDRLRYANGVLKATPLDALRRAMNANGVDENFLLANGIGEISIRERRCETFLKPLFQPLCDYKIIRELGADGITWATWCGDTDTIPGEKREEITVLLGDSGEDLFTQRWEDAETEARLVLEKRGDLSWVFAVLGKCAERRGDEETAFTYYRSGMMTHKATQGFTRNWTYGVRSNPVSYPLYRIVARGLTDRLSPEERDYLNAARSDYDLYPYWRKRAEAAEAGGRSDLAYDFYYNACWDEFQTRDAKHLEGLARTAEAAGYAALHRLAAHHVECFRNYPA